jgi:Protein of unknown function (DUF3303)
MNPGWILKYITRTIRQFYNAIATPTPCFQGWYISSLVDENMQRCYQLMETDDRALIDLWIANWNDIVEFEVYPVINSQEAADRIATLL